MSFIKLNAIRHIAFQSVNVKTKRLGCGPVIRFVDLKHTDVVDIFPAAKYVAVLVELPESRLTAGNFYELGKIFEAVTDKNFSIALTIQNRIIMSRIARTVIDKITSAVSARKDQRTRACRLIGA